MLIKEINSRMLSRACLIKYLIITLVLIQTSCKKLVEVQPPVEQSSYQVVFGSLNGAIEALTGVYADSRESSLFGGEQGVTIGSARLSDEVQRREFSQFDNFYTNSLDPSYEFLWISCYRDYLFRLNSVIEGVSDSKTIPASAKNILLGEAKFMRAYIFFYLVNFYGDIPLVLTTSLSKNREIGRTQPSKVYDQIIKDLNEAKATLSDDFLRHDLTTTTTERIRPNKAAASALLARVYLYTHQWDAAEFESSSILANSRYQLNTTDLNQVFLKTSNEAIWQLQPRVWETGETYTPDGGIFVPFPEGAMPNFIITSFLQSSFEPGDLRYNNWLKTITVGSDDFTYPYKYKQDLSPGVQTEYIMVLRLAEQYLIRAEARAHLNRLTGANSAESDLNIIRSRAGLPNTTASSQAELLDAIAQERRVELFTEGGHRWLDLKRTGKMNEVMNAICPAKGGVWEPYKVLMPIPFREFVYNPSMQGHQNAGYPER